MNSVGGPCEFDPALHGTIDGRRAGLRALLLHALLEARFVDAEPGLGRHLAREVEREAVRVVQQERGVGADALEVVRAGLLDDLVEQLGALLERAVEALLLGAQPLVHQVALLDDPRVGAPHQLGHDVGVAREHREARLDAELATAEDRAAHDPAQDVAAILVGGHDAVGDEERHRAGVIGEHAQGTVDLEARAVALPAELLAQLDQRLEVVGLEDRLGALLDERHPVQAHAGVDVLRRAAA